VDIPKQRLHSKQRILQRTLDIARTLSELLVLHDVFSVDRAGSANGL